MADEQIEVQEQETKTDVPTLSEKLQAAAFDDEPVVQQTQQAEPEKKKEEVDITANTNEEIIDHKEWLKREFDIEDENILKAEREEYKKLKETPKDELKFADEQSKQLHELIRDGKKKEVRQFLETQEKLETLVGAEVNDDTANDILKLQLKLKYKDLNDREIEHKFNKTYGLPKEPVQSATELDEDFADRQAEWKEKVDDIKMSKIIDAKTAKPELEKFKTELVLPEIQQKEIPSANKPTQEDLDALKKDQDAFLQSAEQTITSFNGFSANVKDKDVDYTSSYTPSQEEKTLVSSKLKEFAESGFNANSLFLDRWVNKDNTLNVNQMTEDLSRIYMGKNSDQKIANDAANKRLEIYLKEKKQINVNEQNQKGTFNLNKNQNETVSDKLREVQFG